MVNNPQILESEEFYRESATTSADDNYENEFERVMEEQEKDETSTSCDMSSGVCGGPPITVTVECDANYLCSTPTISEVQDEKVENNINRVNNELKEINKSVKIPPVLQTSIEYPPELNPFGDGEGDKVQQLGTDSKISKNPFGDSEEEDAGQSVVESSSTAKYLTPPRPATRRSPSARKKPVPSASLNPFWEDGVEPTEDAEKLPIPLPRTVGISKSMPSTPDQSPQLRLSRSFRQPGSGPLSGTGASAYYSMRRKKKHAPPPPIASPLSTVLPGATSSRTATEDPRPENSTARTPNQPRRARPESPPPLGVSATTSPPAVTEAPPSENRSPRTLTRPRKARPAPPPPPLKSNT